MNNKLSLKNINVKYGESLALKSINLDIYKGEFVVLLGSSGAGKSTLLRTINQLNPLTSGELDFFDLGKIRNKKDLQNLRKKTGMIFQQHQLIERNTVFQNIIYKVIFSSLSFFFLSNRSQQSVSISSI